MLRHVTQLSGAPVIVDRPGGMVHSERELRIVLPVSESLQANEAAAVAVEFGVLRGLLDLVTPPPSREFAGGGPRRDPVARRVWGYKKKLMDDVPPGRARVRRGVGAGSFCSPPGYSRAHSSPPRIVCMRHPCRLWGGPLYRRRAWWKHAGVNGACTCTPEAALAPAPAQGQFAAGELNLALIGGSAVSSSMYDSGNTALKVNCVVGCGADLHVQRDNAAFSAGSTAVNNISAVFNDSIAALTRWECWCCSPLLLIVCVLRQRWQTWGALLFLVLTSC